MAASTYLQSQCSEVEAGGSGDEGQSWLRETLFPKNKIKMSEWIQRHVSCCFADPYPYPEPPELNACRVRLEKVEALAEHGGAL